MVRSDARLANAARTLHNITALRCRSEAGNRQRRFDLRDVVIQSEGVVRHYPSATGGKLNRSRASIRFKVR